MNSLLLSQKSYFEALSRYFRSHPLYGPSLMGILDWQRLFLVRAYSLLRPSGRIGAIVPSSLVADRSAGAFRRYLLTHGSLVRVDQLTETAKLFPGVNQPTCILVAAKGTNASSFVMSRPTRSVPVDNGHEFWVSINAIQKVSPETLAIPSTDSEGWRILEKLHRWPRLKDDRRISNLRGELDLTAHKSFIGGRTTRLIRGDHIERFQVRSAEQSNRDGYVRSKSFLAAIGQSPKASHIARPRVVGRQCAFLEKNRRLSFAIVGPGAIVANSCNYLLWEGPYEKSRLLFLLGILNSSVVEWRFGLTSTNNHVNNYEIDDLPVPQTDPTEIIRYTRSLIRLYANLPFGASANGQGELEARLDAAAFRAYGLDSDDAERILSEIAQERTQDVIQFMKG
jgi:Alw26I/Eco31I/Esp3I family type II restriction m6 adenine DNA methyltransferase